MKITCLLGSPRRNGNSDQLANLFCELSKNKGADVQVVPLSNLNYTGRQNLFRCKSDLNWCGLQDDISDVLVAIARSDVLVLASPVFFTNVSGQLKLVIDRMFSFLVPDYATNPIKSRIGNGKHLVLVQTQGEPKERYGNLLEQYSTGFQYLGFDHQHLIRAWGVREPNEAINQKAFIENVENVVQRLFNT